MRSFYSKKNLCPKSTAEYIWTKLHCRKTSNLRLSRTAKMNTLPSGHRPTMQSQTPKNYQPTEYVKGLKEIEDAIKWQVLTTYFAESEPRQWLPELYYAAGYIDIGASGASIWDSEPFAKAFSRTWCHKMACIPQVPLDFLNGRVESNLDRSRMDPALNRTRQDSTGLDSNVIFIRTRKSNRVESNLKFQIFIEEV